MSLYIRMLGNSHTNKDTFTDLPFFYNLLGKDLKVSCFDPWENTIQTEDHDQKLFDNSKCTLVVIPPPKPTIVFSANDIAFITKLLTVKHKHITLFKQKHYRGVNDLCLSVFIDAMLNNGALFTDNILEVMDLYTSMFNKNIDKVAV